MNEFADFTSNTRIGLQSVASNCYNLHNLLQKLSNHAKIALANRKGRKSCDSYGGIPYCRRNRATTQDFIRHGRSSFARKEDARLQDLWVLESESNRLRGLAGKSEEYPGTRRPEINTAGLNRQATTNKFVAFRLPASVFQAVTDNPRNSLPIFSIHRRLPYGKVLCKRTWACEK